MTDTPAFPVPGLHRDTYNNGMTLRQYAAIKLRVPDSGTDWMDDMIRKSNRNEIAASLMPAILNQLWSMGEQKQDVHITAIPYALEVADEMIVAQEKQS